MNLIDIKMKALAAIREIAMAVEFAEQASEAIEDGAFQKASDTEINSAEAALITACSLCDEIGELLAAARKEA